MWWNVNPCSSSYSLKEVARLRNNACYCLLFPSSNQRVFKQRRKELLWNFSAAFVTSCLFCILSWEADFSPLIYSYNVVRALKGVCPLMAFSLWRRDGYYWVLMPFIMLSAKLGVIPEQPAFPLGIAGEWGSWTRSAYIYWYYFAWKQLGHLSARYKYLAFLILSR
jgi:hypothetical protein